MAQDLGLDVGTTATSSVAFITTNLATANSSAWLPTGGVDLGDPTPLELAYRLEVSAGASADNFGYIYAGWSQDGSNFSNSANAETIIVINSEATTLIKQNGTFPVRGRYVRFYLDNETGGALTAGANFKFSILDLFGNQV